MLMERPHDVCDDLDEGQYAIFSVHTQCGEVDPIVVGTAADYTWNQVPFMATLSGTVGTGAQQIDSPFIYGLDVVEQNSSIPRFYILERGGGDSLPSPERQRAGKEALARQRPPSLPE